MLTKTIGFGVVLATTAMAAEYEVADFNSKLFWKRPE